MEDRKLEIKFKENESLLDIKQKASELKHTIECIRLDGTQTWREILKSYSLASSTIHYLQGYLNAMLEHRVLVPNYNLHEDPNYVPSIISSKLNDNIEAEASQAIREFDMDFAQLLDTEDQVNRFNSFCHELRSVFKK
jgi:hypothetical protein